MNWFKLVSDQVNRLLNRGFFIIQVLWSNSNWHAIPLANLRDGSQVKKAYQKARLCLHPDKLQQRGGASPIQKSVASRVFAILQVLYRTKTEIGSTCKLRFFLCSGH